MSLAQPLALARDHPDDPVIIAQLAQAALREQQEDLALPVVLAAADRMRTQPRLWQWAGLLQRALDDREAAISSFTIAAEQAPEDPGIAHGLARNLLEAGQSAINAFANARILAPQDGEVVLGMAAALAAEGRAAEGIAILDGMVGVNPFWLQAHRDLIQMRWMMGDGAASFDALRRAAAANPNNMDVWHQLVLSLMQADRNEEGLEVVARARASAGGAVALDVNEAVMLSDLGRVDEADLLFDRLGDLDDVTVAIRIIRHRLRNARIEGAIEMIDRWIGRPGETLIYPYAAIAWRMLDDPRLHWLEGDDALVRTFDIGSSLPSLDRLAEVLRGLHKAKHQHLDQSVRGGTQTDGSLFWRIEPEIKALRAAISDAVRAYVAGLPAVDPGHPTLSPRRDLPPRFSGSWSVRLSGQGYHSNHIHPLGWISSALYVALPDADPDDLPQAGWLGLGSPQSELGLDLPPVRMVEPKPGQLVLFPSTMWHGTIPFKKGERLTVAFDVARPLEEAA